VQGENRKRHVAEAVVESKLWADAGLFRDRRILAERVDHDVANEVDALAGTALPNEVFDPRFLCLEKIVSQDIG